MTTCDGSFRSVTIRNRLAGSLGVDPAPAPSVFSGPMFERFLLRRDWFLGLPEARACRKARDWTPRDRRDIASWASGLGPQSERGLRDRASSRPRSPARPVTRFLPP